MIHAAHAEYRAARRPQRRRTDCPFHRSPGCNLGQRERSKDYVTEIDKAAEQSIVAALRKAYPNHGILGEEGGLLEGSGDGADYLWIIDPLDGTTNFVRGIPHYAVSIACKYRGRLEHAVVLDPVRQEEFTASRGRGAALNGRRLRVSSRKSLDGALLGTGFPFRTANWTTWTAT